ncbi:S8 family peptidase [Streptomyces sp. NPDC004732]|uniref:S8 family peptidase n=1 Tax=Streptomyces sp. NPDC004732 TaxID=3154290 RepID=UPI0033A81A8D
MRLSARCVSAALVLLVPLAAAHGAAADEPSGRAAPAPLHRAAEALPGRYIVTLDKGVHPAATAAEVRGVEPLHTYRTALNGFYARLDATQLARVRALPGVTAVEEDGVVSAPRSVSAATRSTTEAASSWGLDRIDQRDWDKSTGTGDGQFTVKGDGAGVTAYMVGTGIDFGHDEFEGRATAGTDTVGDGRNGADCNGEGTHGAGTVAGRTYGVARKANLVSVRVLNCTGAGTVEGVIAGLDWIAANAKKPAAANISVNAGKSEALNTAATALSDAGITPAISAFSDMPNACTQSPASAERVITVATSSRYDEADTVAGGYTGLCVSIFAPGAEITSAKLGGGSTVMTGAAMSAPHVTGTIALYLAAHPDATIADINEWLEEEATMDALTGIGGSATTNRLLYTGGL